MRYDYEALVLGGGAAGLAAATIASGLGAKTAIIEAKRLGGDCTWTGCVPSKALIQAARIAHTVRASGQHGVVAGPPTVEFDRVIANVHRVREQIYSEGESPEVLNKLGIDVVVGFARFIDSHTLEVDGPEVRQVSGKNIFIATGSSPAIPAIPGLKGARFLTNESIFDIQTQPGHLAIIGAGPVGCELGQAFQRLGSRVTILEERPGILEGDDEELSSILQDLLEDEGIRFIMGSKITKVVSTGSGSILEIEHGGAVKDISADEVLVAAGRQVSCTDLGLDAAGIRYTADGIEVDDRGRTSVKHVFAIGDVTGKHLYTHMAEHAARVAVLTALTKTQARLDLEQAVWCTFTDPELAQLGPTEAELKTSGTNFQVYRIPYAKVDRAIADGQTDGWIKVCAKKATGRILGVAILGPGAGEQIGLFALAMANGLTLKEIADTVFPYPTYSSGNRNAAVLWNHDSMNDGISGFMQRAFRLRGQIPDIETPDDRIV